MAARRESGRDAAWSAAIAAIDPLLYERSPLEILCAMAGRQPDQPVIVDSGRATSYGAFCRLIAAYAGQLGALDARTGEAVGGPVAVLVRDTVDAAAALFACLAVGRICVPLDDTAPVERNAGIARAAGAAILIFGADEAAAAEGVVAEGMARLMLARTGNIPNAGMPMLRCPLDIDAPAFILATSGSTGQPKLVVHSQRTMARRAAVFRLAADDAVLTTSGAPGSYNGLRYLLAVIGAGGRMHYADVRQDGYRRLLERMAAERITIFRASPSLLRVLAALPGAREKLAGLRGVRSSGESLAHADVRMLRAVLPAGCWIRNTWGSTEATNFHWEVPEAETHDPVRVAVGFIDPGGEAAILNEAGGLCAPGEVGELVVRSRYNALGEWEDGRLVAGRLIPDPSAPGCRVYFSGDLARASADGAVTVLGRLDRMLKINGQRVEPVEVEAAIRQLMDVEDVIVLPRVVGEVTTLIAFVVPGREAGMGARDLRAALRARLPAHMLPSRIVLLDALPRSTNGKVDAVALLAGLGSV